MRAVIFAAGRGRRLRPLTDSVPKPMIEIGGKPILGRTLESLPASVDHVVVVVGHLGDRVRRFLSGPASMLRRIDVVEQKELRGTYDALLTACADLTQVRQNSERVLALNGDDLYAKEDLERLSAVRGSAVMTREIPGCGKFSHLETAEGRLARILAAAEHDGPSTRVYTGAAIINHEFFGLRPYRLPNGEYSLPHTLADNLNTHPVHVTDASFWIPVGTPWELRAAEGVFAH